MANQANNGMVTRAKTGLRGIRQEKRVTLYLKSVQVKDETDEEIGKMAREYARSKRIQSDVVSRDKI